MQGDKAVMPLGIYTKIRKIFHFYKCKILIYKEME